jgi:hypothetical protein
LLTHGRKAGAGSPVKSGRSSLQRTRPFKSETFMDQSADKSGRQLYKLVQLFPPPEFVKEASAEELCGSPELEASVFADPRRKNYPCHTASATWASYGFFLHKKADYRPSDAEAVEERFRHFAGVHGITGALDEMAILHEQRAKQAGAVELKDDDYAFVIVEGDEKIRRCPMRNARETIKAAEYLLKYRDEMTFEVRQGAAERITEKAAAMGVNLGEAAEPLERQAGRGACLAREAAELIVDRVQASRRGPGPLSEEQGEMLKLAKTCMERPAQIRQPGALAKLAAVIDMFDHKNSLHKRYDQGLPRPEDVLFAVTGEKMASVARHHCATPAGAIYNIADLEKIRLRDVRDMMGGAAADALSLDGVHLDVEKLAAAMPGFSRQDAEMFDRLAEDAGVMPIAKEASAMSSGISRDYLRQLAEDYRETMQAAPKSGPRKGGLIAQFKP